MTHKYGNSYKLDGRLLISFYGNTYNVYSKALYGSEFF